MSKLSLLKVVKASKLEIINMFVNVAQQKHLPCVVASTKNYVYIKGNTPVMLLAHMDTVHITPPVTVLYDPKEKMAWSPEGIGGDDRCGIFSILAVLYAGYTPSVLICDKEEIGCIGASEFARDYPTKPIGLKYLLEIDRRGHDDVVYYSCGNDEFQKYVESFGFKKQYGSCSDISKIMTPWNIAGANVSAGYLREHTKEEHIMLSWMQETIIKVKQMLSQNMEIVPEYDQKPAIATTTYGGYYENGVWKSNYANNYGRGYQSKKGGSAYDDYYDSEEYWKSWERERPANKWGGVTPAVTPVTQPQLPATVDTLSKALEDNIPLSERADLDDVIVKKLAFDDRVFISPIGTASVVIDNKNGWYYLDATSSVIFKNPKTGIGEYIMAKWVSRTLTDADDPKTTRTIFLKYYQMDEVEPEHMYVDYSK